MTMPNNIKQKNAMINVTATIVQQCRSLLRFSLRSNNLSHASQWICAGVGRSSGFKGVFAFAAGVDRGIACSWLC